MISVKHVCTSGRETIWLAHEATFVPSEENATCFTRSPIESAHDGGCVNIIRQNGVMLCLCGGTVFVMNDHGKTVARYNLGHVDIPVAA